jgi:hypothetical protein
MNRFICSIVSFFSVLSLISAEKRVLFRNESRHTVEFKSAEQIIRVNPNAAFSIKIATPVVLEVQAAGYDTKTLRMEDEDGTVFIGDGKDNIYVGDDVGYVFLEKNK